MIKGRLNIGFILYGFRMSYLPYSNRFAKIFSDSKELTKVWKAYGTEFRNVAEVISEYDRQVQAIRKACEKGGDIQEYCPGNNL